MDETNNETPAQAPVDTPEAPETPQDSQPVIVTDEQGGQPAPEQVQTHTTSPADYGRKALSFAKENPNAMIFGAAVLGLLILLWLIARARKAELGLFRNPSGRVSVSRNALADLVETVARSVPGTVKPRAYFRKRGGLVNVKLRLKLKGRRKLTGFTSDIQERITLALRDALGDEQIGQIDVIVTGFYDLGTREQAPEGTSKEIEENMNDVL